MPLPLFFLILAASVITIRRKKISRVLMGMAVLWLVVVSASPVPELLAKNLENRYEVLHPETVRQGNKAVHLLVLGGGHTNDERLPPNNRLTLTALGRLAEGIRLQRQIPGSLLITSGWSSSGKTTQAEMLARTALLLGMDSSVLRMQTKPQNTMEEAAEYKRLFGDSAVLVIVTSAVHMPRAMYLFRREGLAPLAAPTSHMVKQENRTHWWYWFPSANKIRMMESVMHEYGGIVVARMDKWTN